MSAEVDPVFWSDEVGELEDQPQEQSARRRVLQFRHRIGDYDVTRLILESDIQEMAQP